MLRLRNEGISKGQILRPCLPFCQLFLASYCTRQLETGCVLIYDAAILFLRCLANCSFLKDISAVSYDIETIIQQDPDVILIRSGSVKGDGSGRGNGKGQGSGSEAAKGEDAQKILGKYYKDPLYKDLRAVKNGNVYLLPGTINPGTISIEEAMQITAEIIYPEIFKQ